MINCFSYQDSKFFCDFCPYVTHTYHTIVRHLKRHRTCWKCSKRFFGSKFLWKRHTKSCSGLKKETHNNICQFCKRDFVFPSKLRKHIYKCELKHTLHTITTPENTYNSQHSSILDSLGPENKILK